MAKDEIKDLQEKLNQRNQELKELQRNCEKERAENEKKKSQKERGFVYPDRKNNRKLKKYTCGKNPL